MRRVVLGGSGVEMLNGARFVMEHFTETQKVKSLERNW